jgi:predicted PurR-regulated permease PerM
VSAVVLVVLVVGLLTVSVLVVVAVGLIRHLKLLAESAGAFRKAVQPALEELQREASRAEENLRLIERRRSGMRAGARLRR